jgi:glycosyltransferase involved in cell wall biosynthesis
MIEGLRLAGVEVVECNVRLWTGVEDRVEAASGGWLSFGFLRRLIKTYLQLLKIYRSSGYYDILIVGYPGQMDIFLARILSWIRRKPMVWDIFMSIYLISLERRLDKRSPLTINMLRCIEWLACRLPDLLILDTEDYVSWFQTTHGVSPTRFRLIPTGADDRIFQPRENRITKKDHPFCVLYYGTFIPNHGVEYIVEAARLLADKSEIQFTLVGSGPDKEKAIEMTDRFGISNVQFIDWLDKKELVTKIAEADICLGAFGETPQSLMTVQNKIYEGMAMAKPVLTGDSPAIRSVLRHKEHVYLCGRKNPQAIMEGIIELQSNPGLREALSRQGHKIFMANYTLDKLGQYYSHHLNLLIT